MRRIIATPLIALAALAAGAATPAPAESTAMASASAVRHQAGVVGVRSSRFGRILTDGRGFTLYLFTHDRRNQSRCYGSCAKAWPPLLAQGRPRATTGARRSLLGTTRRREGTRQVTYRGWPLYYYVGEKSPLQVLCQNVFEFGGTWLVVSPRGTAIR
jgi:predicted lipoprotein with Yx(FWY)xxD motif